MQLLDPKDLAENVFNTFRYEADQIEYLEDLIGTAKYLIDWINLNSEEDTYV